ncbi:MAG: flagellar type III secretion system pore protein FliP [Armatimonadia bacterium]
MRRLVWLGALALVWAPVQAQQAGPVRVDLGGGNETSYLRLLLLFASVSLAPALLAVLTSFLRIAVVLFFLRAGLGSQQILPNPVLIGLAILLTVFTMSGTLGLVNERAVQPLLAGKTSLTAAANAAEGPVRQYLSAHARGEDLALFRHYEKSPPRTDGQPAFTTLAAAYVISELRAAFIIGFVIYLPFLVIELVVAGTIASLGLVSLPQAMISLPFKILLFVMVDGWRLLADALIRSM